MNVCTRHKMILVTNEAISIVTRSVVLAHAHPTRPMMMFCLRMQASSLQTALLKLNTLYTLAIVMQVDMAMANILEAEVPVKRLLMLLEMARQGIPDNSTIPIPHWSQVLRDLAG